MAVRSQTLFMQGANFTDKKREGSAMAISKPKGTSNKPSMSQKQKLHVQADFAEMLSVKLLSVKLGPLMIFPELSAP